MEAKNGSTRTAKESELKQRQFQFESISFEIDQQRRYWSNRLWLNFKKFLIKIYFFKKKWKSGGRRRRIICNFLPLLFHFLFTSSLLPDSPFFRNRLPAPSIPLRFRSDSNQCPPPPLLLPPPFPPPPLPLPTFYFLSPLFRFIATAETVSSKVSCTRLYHFTPPLQPS